MTRDPLVIVATLSVAGLAFFLLIEHVPKWVRALASWKPFDGIRTALAPIALPGWIKIIGFFVWCILFATLLVGVGLSINTALTMLPTVDDASAQTRFRAALLTITAMTATLGAVIALPFTLRRTIQNERQTRTQEEGYVTQQINEAVANLAADKEVSRVWRTIEFDHSGQNVCEIESTSARHPLPEGVTEKDVTYGTWQLGHGTKPNIEVRIGAILALERLARQRAEVAVRDKQNELQTEPEWRKRATARIEQAPELKRNSVHSDEFKRLVHRTPDGVLDHDGARDHVRIMEILTAYTRENAPGSRASDPPSQEEQTEEESKKWTEGLKRIGLRTDISALMRVLGRRTPEQRACEGHLSPDPAAGSARPLRQRQHWHGKRLDLSRNNYQGADLSHSNAQPLNLAFTDFNRARMEGAVLRHAQMQGADLGGAQMQGAILWHAQMQRADLWRAQMDQTTDFRPATMRGAGLKSVDLSMLDVDPDILAEAFGDATVTLPDGLVAGAAPLAHWSTEDLEYRLREKDSPFHIAWRAFQKDIDYQPKDRD